MTTTVLHIFTDEQYDWHLIDADNDEQHLIPDKEHHIVPINDHGKVLSLECHCKPYRHDENQKLVIHNKIGGVQ